MILERIRSYSPSHWIPSHLLSDWLHWSTLPEHLLVPAQLSLVSGLGLRKRAHSLGFSDVHIYIHMPFHLCVCVLSVFLLSLPSLFFLVFLPPSPSCPLWCPAPHSSDTDNAARRYLGPLDPAFLTPGRKTHHRSLFCTNPSL